MSLEANTETRPSQRHGSTEGADGERSDSDRNGTENGDGRTHQPGSMRSKPVPLWSIHQIGRVGVQAALVLVLFSLLGFAFRPPASSYVARTEFVYSLDESIPDSFLREDRRLLTQIATLESDAVLTPVAERFDITPDDLRDAMAVATVDLSEVLRLDLRDPNPDRAGALSDAIMAEYTTVASQAPSSDLAAGLRARRSEIVGSLADADSELLALERGRVADPALATTEESLERQIAYRSDQINRLQALLDNTVVRPIGSSREADLNDQLAQAKATLAELEIELSGLRTTITNSEAETTAELAVLRDIDRLEAELKTIDDELALRELRPLIASPIRVLGKPTVAPDDATLARLRGPAIGLLIALPVAAAVAYRTRQRQLWFGK